jgi:hypothetical protein
MGGDTILVGYLGVREKEQKQIKTSGRFSDCTAGKRNHCNWLVHFALLLVKISINFSPSYSTVFFFHHTVRLYCTKISKF